MPTSKTASRSGNPAKAASSASEFKKKTAGIAVELPSGLTAVIRRLGVTVLLAENLLGDQLTALAQDAVDKAKGKLPEELRDEVAQDPSKVAAMMEAFDKITVRTWVSPKVTFFRGEDGEIIPDEDRDDDLLYSDEIDLGDKIFTFNWVAGGSSDLVRFRQQYGELMAGISAGEGVGVSAE